jgi:hypothetical protein
METTPDNAQATARKLITMLQDAHFLARHLESYFPPRRDNRIVDHIHAARVLAEHLRAAG